MPGVAKRLEQRTELAPSGIQFLESLVEQWSILADLAFSDLVLWVPTWNEGGLLAVDQVRAATAPTSIAEELTGQFSPRGRNAALDKAAALDVSVCARDKDRPLDPLDMETYPVRFEGSTIAVLARYPSPSPRVAGQLEQVYLQSADSIFSMITHGLPWLSGHEGSLELWDRPRVGDGLIRLDAEGVVDYASPNATSNFRRLGLATPLNGQNFQILVKKLDDSPTGVSRSLDRVSRGGYTGFADIQGSDATIMVHSVALLSTDSSAHSTVLILKDVTAVRTHQRALLSKDATIKEINHRVKNNLQMVSSVLRLQSRRADQQETKDALREAQQRINAMAAIHDVLSRDVVTTVDFDDLIDSIIAVATDGFHAAKVQRVGSGGVLPNTIATPLAMSLSELLHNSLEHAHADSITVEIMREGVELISAVVDDGIGFSGEPGLGLSIVTDLVTTELQGSFQLEVIESSASESSASESGASDSSASTSRGTRAQIVLRLPRTSQQLG